MPGGFLMETGSAGHVTPPARRRSDRQRQETRRQIRQASTPRPRSGPPEHLTSSGNRWPARALLEPSGPGGRRGLSARASRSAPARHQPAAVKPTAGGPNPSTTSEAPAFPSDLTAAAARARQPASLYWPEDRMRSLPTGNCRGRKVRTPTGSMLANGKARRRDGKCSREQTAYPRCRWDSPRVRRGCRGGKGETVWQERTARPATVRGDGKPHVEQDQIGRTERAVRPDSGPFSDRNALRVGRKDEWPPSAA